MAARSYDVVVVGGGIHGVGVAQAAAAAGHSVLVIEKGHLAAGTSNWSSKLIHGGLRYLESGHLGLVFESLRERDLLLRNAPDLVRLKKFFIPVYPATRRRPWVLRAGLSLYAVLGRLRRSARFSSVPRRDWETLDGLRTDELQAVLSYYDGQTDDALLTRAVMRSAETLGAELAAPAEFVGADTRADANGSVVRYRSETGEHSCRARMIVNAAGPWANIVLDRIRPAHPALPVELVQGTHIILGGEVQQGIYYVESPRDGRAVFVMPWYDKTLVGTTETRFHGDPDKVRPLAAERTYLARVLQHYFPRYDALANGAIEDAFAGLRVLPSGSGHAFHRSRETIFLSFPDGAREPPRVLSIYGGKLTGYRATAEKALGHMAAGLPRRKPVADTCRLRLELP